MTDRELIQQALDLLDDINQCSLPPAGIPLPAEIDHVREALRNRLEKWTVKDMAYRPGGLSQSKPVMCGCGDQIMPDDGAECGNCVAARNAVKPEWVGLTDGQKKMAYALYGTMTAEGFVKSLETKLREKNT